MLGAGLASLGCARTPSGDCLAFTRSTVEAMRRAGERGCFELPGLVVEGRTASATAPRLFATDPDAGPLSAIMAKCSDTAEPRCDDEARSAVAQVLRGAVVTLRGFYFTDPDTGFEELALQELDDPGVLADPPAPRLVDAAELGRGARARSAWYHYVSVDVPASDPWGLTDLSPPELVRSSCPRVSGFAVGPVGPASAPAGCDGLVSPPPGEPDPSDVLIGRAFFHDFTWSTDCACAEAHHQHLLPADATFAGELRGILTFSMPLGGASGWQVLEPLANADLPLNGP